MTLDYIEALVAKGYGAIYVQDPEDPIYVPPDEDLNPVTRAKAVHALDRVYSAIKDEIGDLREQTFERLKGICHSQAMKSLLGERGPFEALNTSTNTILNEVLDHKILAGLTTIKMTDTYLHHHCIDVCVISIMLGQALELSEDHLRQLATGCILHDIGKVFLRQRVAPITEIRQHTLLGYELLRSGENADILAPHVALEHHEYQDGSGEPRGLRGTNTIERNRKKQWPRAYVDWRNSRRRQCLRQPVKRFRQHTADSTGSCGADLAICSGKTTEPGNRQNILTNDTRLSLRH